MSGGHGHVEKLFPSFGAENAPQEATNIWVYYVGPGAILTLLANLVLPDTHPPSVGGDHGGGHGGH